MLAVDRRAGRASARRWRSAGSLRGLLFQIGPRDPLSIAAAAAVDVRRRRPREPGPAWRAARVDPVVALKSRVGSSRPDFVRVWSGRKCRPWLAWHRCSRCERNARGDDDIERVDRAVDRNPHRACRRARASPDPGPAPRRRPARCSRSRSPHCARAPPIVHARPPPASARPAGTRARESPRAPRSQSSARANGHAQRRAHRRPDRLAIAADRRWSGSSSTPSTPNAAAVRNSPPTLSGLRDAFEREQAPASDQTRPAARRAGRATSARQPR